VGFQVLTTTGQIKSFQVPTEVTISTTGNIDDLDFSNADLIRMTNSSLTTIRGLKAGYAGQRVAIVSLGAGQVDLAHQNTNSSAANRCINTVTGLSTPLAAGTGRAVYQYDATTLRWRLIHHQQGSPIAVTYSAGDYTASTGTWTVDSGDVATYQFVIENNIVTFLVQIQDTDVSVTPATLWAAMPAGMTAVKTVRAFLLYQDAGGANTGGLFSVIAADTKLSFNKLGSNWSATTGDNTLVAGQLRVQIT